MIKIGIIDDQRNERDDIQVSIIENASGEQIQFKEYELQGKTLQELKNEIEADIVNGDIINALVVDYKLDTTKEAIKGWEVLKFLGQEVPKFPVVVLTNVPEESLESEYSDADKVYDKKVFLNPESAETARFVNNIIINSNKYVNTRKHLESALETAIYDWENENDNIDKIIKISTIESELKQYKFIELSKEEELLDMKKLKEGFELLEKSYKLLEEKSVKE